MPCQKHWSQLLVIVQESHIRCPPASTDMMPFLGIWIVSREIVRVAPDFISMPPVMYMFLPPLHMVLVVMVSVGLGFSPGGIGL